MLCFGIAVVTGEVYKDPKDINCSKMEGTSKGNPSETPQPSENQETENMDPPQQDPDVKPKESPPFKQCDPPGIPCYLMVVLITINTLLQITSRRGC